MLIKKRIIIMLIVILLQEIMLYSMRTQPKASHKTNACKLCTIKNDKKCPVKICFFVTCNRGNPKNAMKQHIINNHEKFIKNLSWCGKCQNSLTTSLSKKRKLSISQDDVLLLLYFSEHSNYSQPPLTTSLKETKL